MDGLEDGFPEHFVIGEETDPEDPQPDHEHPHDRFDRARQCGQQQLGVTTFLGTVGAPGRRGKAALRRLRRVDPWPGAAVGRRQEPEKLEPNRPADQDPCTLYTLFNENMNHSSCARRTTP